MAMEVEAGTSGPASVRFTLDGREIEALAGETIWQAAERHGIAIPHLCYKHGQESLRADGNCRVCMVEIEGERVLAPSCIRTPTPGMKVSSSNERARHSQKMVLELLGGDIPVDKPPYVPNSQVTYWAKRMGVGKARFAMRKQPPPDFSHAAIAVNLDACIQCTLCVRACREVQGNDVIGYAQRGVASHIMFDMDDPMGLSTCVGCGECVAACPTGALSNAGLVGVGSQVPLQQFEGEVP